MNRRGFLSLLGMGAAGLAAGGLELDVDKLLWVPGAKTFFLPPAPALYRSCPNEFQFTGPWDASGNQLLTVEWITRETLRILEQNLKFVKHVNRYYDEKFPELGMEITVRKPTRYA